MIMRTLLPFLHIKPRQKILLPVLLAAVCILLTSCGKDQLFDFAKSTGKNVTITRKVDNNFTKIFLNNDVDLVITQGGTYSIKVEGGENLLPGIETSISDSILTIKNTNTFNWLRSYDRKITAYVTLPHILDLHYEATSTVTNTDTIREDSLFVIATGGSGYIKLLVDIGSSHFSINKGSVDMDISGKSGVNYIYSNGFGPFHCLDLKTETTFISNFSTNDCYINVGYFLGYNITGLGNIYYQGLPEIVPDLVSGQGKLIPLP